MFVLAGLASPVYAAENLVVDLAGFLHRRPGGRAGTACQCHWANNTSMDIVIVTTDDAEGKSSLAYADDFFDYNGYGVGENGTASCS